MGCPLTTKGSEPTVPMSANPRLCVQVAGDGQGSPPVQVWQVTCAATRPAPARAKMEREKTRTLDSLIWIASFLVLVATVLRHEMRSARVKMPEQDVMRGGLSQH